MMNVAIPRKFIVQSIISLVFLCGFCNVGVAQNADISLLRKVNQNRSSFKTSFFTITSNSAYVLPFAYPLAQFTYGKIGKTPANVKESFFSSVSLGTASLLSYTLKISIQRPRPYVTYPDLIIDKPSKNYSFPSGHTTVAFCTATSISLYYQKWYVTIPAFLWAGTVSYSRMYLGKHYPTDLIGGILLGTAVPLLFHYCKPVNQFIDKTGKTILKY